LEEVTGALLVTSMEETSDVTRIFYSKFSGDITKYFVFTQENNNNNKKKKKNNAVFPRDVVCLRNISTLHKGDDDDDDDDNNNKTSTNCQNYPQQQTRHYNPC